MPADSLEDIYDFETPVEETLKGVLDGLNFDVVTRLNANQVFQHPRPRVAIRAILGPPVSRNHFQFRDNGTDFEARTDFFNFSLELELVTEPENKPDDNSQHRIYRSRLRAYMGGIEKNFPDMPWHVISRLWFGSTNYIFNQEDGVEISRLSFEGDIWVKPEAWPTIPAPPPIGILSEEGQSILSESGQPILPE